ncbi:MAG: proteasome accessory factor PafA2 family protein [Nitrospina sp.]|jgi:Pup amidohydrolase|nr:proteasome accessory factor PafA2 family protein [Nitrospina sp.]MBT3414493.1 proteasome accessory factor PafA2 family protein [Nitrospina sp.]MBT3855582.1 proteasome accessory factor PafA2 family protein [Nitrospina sp.]MBT4390066.1 proteasome accessory factor PafA2 family protein [Nitrospina sp.]MBT4621141.1 proteasome accessory factor PafA2 family protein [Nitrospina sp.]
MSVPLLGLETEYGIVREDLENSDPVEESMKLLQACERKSVFCKWAYSQENSHLDMRGFRVTSLAQDEEEDAFCAEDRKRSYSYLDMKCDRVLTNGARFYNDHTHPEYSTPECNSVLSLVAHDVAGERIVAECVAIRNRELGGNSLQVFKNNTDYSGHSYGTHDNYLIPRETPFEDVVNGLAPFLVTRQLYAGAGKVGSENADDFQGLQLAQRSDFIETLLSIETMTKRPLINTRDEPHAVSSRYRRLHLILGDANMSAYATALKVGSTVLVLNLIASGEKLADLELADPVADVLRVSLDRTTALQRKTGGTITALEIQEAYVEAAEKAFAGKNREWDWILAEWKRTLDELRHSPEKLSDRIDWAIKEKLFTEFMQSEGIGWEDPWLKSLDLEYHNLDPERGLYLGLQQEGAVHSLLNEKEIARAMESPPDGTRAKIRGQAVAQDAENIKSIHWTGVEFASGELLDLTGVICPEEVESILNEQFV